jgi:hypothetical protein
LVVIFLIWWVALRPSNPCPSVQPLIVAAGKVAQIVVAEVRDHLAQPRVGAEEVLARVLAALDGVALELAVDGGVHLVQQHPVFVLRQQLVPLRAPDDLDHVPAGAAEHRFELLDDLAVAAHRAVETLQVAVDDEDQVVELLASGERDRAERLGFVALAVADEGPYPALRRVVDLAVHQIAVEPGVVQRGDRTEAHRHRGELPEVGHQARVRIARQAAATASDLLTEVIEVGVGEATLEIGAGVDARCRVPLEVHVVAAAGRVLAAEEVVEPDLVQRGRAGERRQVAADAVGVLVGLDDHHRRVPTDEGADAALDVLVAGEPRFELARDGVDVRRADRGREAHLAGAGAIEQLREEESGPALAVRVDHGVERVEPLLSLGRIDVGQLVHESVEDHAPIVPAKPGETTRGVRANRAAGWRCACRTAGWARCR